MKISLKRTITTTIISILVLSATAQTTIVSWGFESGSTSAATGTGTIAGIGGVTTSVDATKGITTGTSTTSGVLESSLTLTGYCFSTINYPAQGTPSKTAGIQINASTSGYKDIIFTMDMRHGNKCANTAVLQYTTDGSSWNDATSYVTIVNNDTWFLRSYDFSSLTEVNNNANFAIRVVSSFASGTSAYAASNSSSSYDVTKGYRFDNISLKGTEITSSEIETVSSNSWKLSGKVLNFGSVTQNKIEVYNLIGIKVASSEPVSQITLPLSQGFYIVKVGTLTKKIFIK
ncbi:MAG: T9SS type A sorting domain-containing protein [Paludibacteraceae bacterium]|nr:T9SS type A sorting domain-containing protein [Paludibacteraceae bacterium]